MISFVIFQPMCFSVIRGVYSRGGNIRTRAETHLRQIEQLQILILENIRGLRPTDRGMHSLSVRFAEAISGQGLPSRVIAGNKIRLLIYKVFDALNMHVVLSIHDTYSNIY